MADAPAQLDYANDPKRRRRLRRAVAAGVLLLALILSVRWLSPAWDHARLLYFQNKCLAHAEPPTRAVYDSAAQSAAISSDWERFYELFSPPGGKHGATVFAHEMRRKDGAARLVVVEFQARAFDDFPRSPLDATVVEPGGAWRRPELRGGGSWATPFVAEKLRLYAGQLDPANPAHVTIAFDYDQHRGTIDGWLREDDSVLFELRESLPHASAR